MIETLYARHRSALVRWCSAMTHGRPEAEDLVQETFLRVLQNPEMLEDLSDAQCRAWLCKTAKNLWIDRLRRAAKAPPLQTEPVFDEDYTRADVANACAMLPQEERALFLLRYFEGYNSTELGEMFCLPPATVRARLASAKRRLLKLYFSEGAKQT
jgi:RNA polymerase sigma-70 factor (ECF subfamily)